MHQEAHCDSDNPRLPVTSVQAQRAQAAYLIERQRMGLHARIHRLLSDDARKLTDTEDILSTVRRRVDRIIYEGRLSAASNEQFYSLVHSVVERAILEKIRMGRRARLREQAAGAVRLRSLVESRGSEAISLTERIGRVLTDPVDRELVLLRGRGLSFEMIAESMKMQPAAVRKRWSRIRARARVLLEGAQAS